MKRFIALVCLLLPSIAFCKTPEEKCAIQYKKDSFSGEETFSPKRGFKGLGNQYRPHLYFYGKKNSGGVSLQMAVSYTDTINRQDPENKVQPVSVDIKVGDRIFKFETPQFTFKIIAGTDPLLGSVHRTYITAQLTQDITDALYAADSVLLRVNKDSGGPDDGKGLDETDFVCLRMLIDEFRKATVSAAGEEHKQP